ncbi:very-long-chain (3R)-3-hydroxyacyl-CoA dehydratase 2-like [Mercenaria mercenaria]|uniref:very-long-chain (3R)-3-hydroxyacyl-CoA dehydratase 2-like n=1 Tax=Mercenaria mercenaria TaxID=6596 RepID=UPI00234E846D|nr:very-long-chain (3R)-3-hydroxyacyl-CoA dehydratase 2-like [Mercenaria mercenaria]
MAASTANKQGPREQNPVTLAYLIAYNVAQVMGWSAILFIFISHYSTENTAKGLYAKVAPLLNIFQTAAILEILHCAVGFVRSSVMLTAFQVFSRIMLTWGIAYSLLVVQNVFGVSMFIFAWSVTEIIRYAFYMFSLIGEVPYALQWCRYTFFIVLYPIGVTGELLSIWSGLDFVRDSKIYSVELPNAANMSFSYYYFLIFFMIMYIPIFPQLYMHMLAQRKKVIGGAGKPKTE